MVDWEFLQGHVQQRLPSCRLPRCIFPLELGSNSVEIDMASAFLEENSSPVVPIFRYRLLLHLFVEATRSVHEKP